jgi:hypothetical protein
MFSREELEKMHYKKLVKLVYWLNQADYDIMLEKTKEGLISNILQAFDLRTEAENEPPMSVRVRRIKESQKEK